ncbi:MAG: hypothetical protein FWD05_05480 [Oscillospiraceae bacterium]|nr:hypothetical protein [Oscillospiraceae bacterium]
MENNNENNNANNNEFSVDTEQLKSETSATVQETREAIKNLDVKKEAAATQGFMKNFFKDPVTHVKAAPDASHLFGMAVFLNLVWIVASVIPAIVNAIRWGRWGGNLLEQLWSIISSAIAPTLGVIVLALLIMAFNKNNKKSLTALIATVTIAYIPSIITSVLALITLLTAQASRLISPLSSFAYVISIVLIFSATKAIFQENEDNRFFMTFVKIFGIYFIVRFGLSFLGIWI